MSAPIIFSGSFAKLLKNALRMGSLSSDPSSASAGDVYYSSTDQALKFHNGTSFVSVGNGGIVTAQTSYTMTIGATTSAPSDGTGVTKSAKWRRVGEYMEIEFNYVHTGAGSAGTGAYLFPIPSGYTIDTSKVVSVSTAAATTLNKGGNAVGYADVATTTTGNGNHSTNGTVSVYNSTNLTIALTSTDNVQYPFSSSHGNYNFGVTTLYVSFFARVPISGWSAQQTANNAVLYSTYSLNNYSLSATVNSNALTIALKDYAGNDPSSTSPVQVAIRSATAANGDYSVLSVQAATSLVISSGSTLGTTNSTAFKIWIVTFNDGGTLRLGAINCLTATNGNIYPLGQFPIASSTAEGGAGGADTTQTFYTGTAVTSKPYTVLGYLSYESGLGTAGTWSAAPTRIELHKPGMPLPGQSLQKWRNQVGGVASGTTTLPADDTIPQNTEGTEFMTRSITPTSASNVLRISSQLNGSHSAGAFTAFLALFQDSTVNALAVSYLGTLGGSTWRCHGYLEYYMQAGTTSSTTFKIRAGANEAGTFTFNGYGGTNREMGGTLASFLQVEEVMA